MTCVLGVIGLNPGQVKSVFLSCSHHVVNLYLQKITIPKSCIFQKSVPIHHCMALWSIVNYTSQVSSFAMLVLPIARILKEQFQGRS